MDRRAVRALLRLHDIPAEPGDCHTACAALAKLIPGARAVRGWASESAGVIMTHSWLETPTQIIDPTMGQFNEHGESGRHCAPCIGIWSRLGGNPNPFRVAGLNGAIFSYRDNARPLARVCQPGTP